MLQISTGITTAPRDHSYLDKTINSVPITLGRVTYFSEPGTGLIPDKYTVVHKIKKGCLRNWDFAARYLLNLNSDFVCILQDDIEFAHTSIANSLEPNDKAGFYSFYTPKLYKNKLTKSGWQAFNNGWYSVGACALLFPKRSLFLLLEHPEYLNHLLNYKKNEQVDSIVCSVMQTLNLPTYYHSPSLCRHIGEVSSINHNHMPQITEAL